MTFEQDYDPTSDDGFDSFDPLIAERFEVLNAIRVPSHGERAQPHHAVAPPPPTGYRPFVALAAAAALFVVVGVSFLAMRPTTDQDVTASNGADAEVDGDRLQDKDGQDKEELTVKVPESSTTTQDAGQAEGERSTSETGADGTEEAGPGEEAGSPGAGQSEPTDPSAVTTTTQQQGATTTKAPANETTTPTTSRPPKEPLPPVSAPPPVPTTEHPDFDERIITLRGIVEEVFTDCESKLILDENGNVAQGGPVSCDGGSYVVIDGRRIQTSAGYVAADQYYNRHNARLRPGQSVLVFAVPSYWSQDSLTLDCGQCGISLGG